MDRAHQIRTALEATFTIDVTTLDRDGIDAALSTCTTVTTHLEAFRQRLCARTQQLAAAGHSADAETVLTDVLGKKGARDEVGRTETCEAIPSLGEALDSGDITAAHLDAVHHAETGLSDAERDEFHAHGDALTDAAKGMTPEQLRRHARELANRCKDRGTDNGDTRRRAARKLISRYNTSTGMHHWELILDDESNASFQGSLGAIVATARSHNQGGENQPFPQFQLDALLQHLAATTTVDAHGKVTRPEFTLLVDEQTIRDGVHDGTVCEYSNGTRVPYLTMLRYLCDCDLTPATINQHGVTLNLGRTRRVASRAQRQALRAMYATCAYPGCTVPVDGCRAHHLIYWENGGPTDLENLVPVCERHHHLIHEGGWTLRLTEPDTTRTLHWIQPDGNTYTTTTPDRTHVQRHVGDGSEPDGKPPDRDQGRDPGDPVPPDQPTLFNLAG